MFRKSLILMGVSGISLTVLAVALASPLSQLFVGYDAELYEMTCHGFRLYALSFLVSGFNIFSSAFFTALNNGLVSATISFSRTLLFQCLIVLVLPTLLGLDGIWLAVVVAELLALVITVVFFISKRKQYHYT